ncbi:hypothetical protein ACGFWE_13805 [Streptomyces sp. NPDC048523]|uniref:hypothetical protein n=1 Tax=unclassified Streptomyces TaxID=2593676 RepID=UPI003721530B|nr:hypothetical protein OG331_31900 [Streptomyces sp. NBC_01017]
MTESTTTAPSCGSACAEQHTYADRCVLAPLYPSVHTDERLLAALEDVRKWRHRQPNRGARHFAELDAILDAAALGRIRREVGEDVPASLPEAVAAHHRIMAARRRALDDLGRVWDAAEAAAIRQIARFMPIGQASR